MQSQINAGSVESADNSALMKAEATGTTRLREWFSNTLGIRTAQPLATLDGDDARIGSGVKKMKEA